MSDSDRDRAWADQLPQARVGKNWRTYLFWLVPLGAALLAGWFIYTEIIRSGPKLHIYFDDAAGLQQGKSQVKYRGAQIGSVKEIKLTKDHSRVEVIISLVSSAEGLAREGSRFWIVKPRVGLAQIRGLQTIVAGDYVTVEPGAGKRQTIFQGLAGPPITVTEGEGATHRIVLLAEKLGSFKKNSPVLYRGVQVGQVRDFDLGPTSQAVRIALDIQREYAPLVRLNSKFWNAGGINFSIGLSGMDISAASAQTLVTGGIAFATPDSFQREAPGGTFFRLYDKPDPSWLAWSPTIPLSHHRHSTEQKHKKDMK
ncbi:MlaD family protein [Geotalea sp. SG265]|uniref:PqiB family protein n=1 Tax=Geotalea sp. SG265 TaxID=2922867 RepID=UPI001FAF59E8|nr:MlaD family protein [Geotalea sp. SG265]